MHILDYWAVDSLSIRMPLDRLKTYDKTLHENIKEIDPHGEIIREKKYMYKYEIDGINVYADIQEFYTSVGNNKKTQFLVVVFSSKLLRHKYFTGIRAHHMKYLSNILQRFGFATWDYNTFKNARPVDIDFKKDIYQTYDKMKSYMSELGNLTKETKQSSHGYKFYENVKKQNLGIEFGKRSGAGTTTLPYLKYYFKNGELNTRSRAFKEKYLTNNKKQPVKLSKTILRCEYTIKGRKQFKQISDLPFTLKNVLSLSQTELQKESIRIHTYYLNINQIKRRMTEEQQISAIEVMTKLMLTTQAENGEFYDQAITNNYTQSLERLDDFLGNKPNERTMKSKLRKRIEETYQILRKDEPVLSSNFRDIHRAFLSLN